MLAFYLPWILSALTIYTMYLAGEQKTYTWLVGLINQFLWSVWIIVSSSWGLIPMNIALWIIYIENHFKWNNGKTKNRNFESVP